MMNDLAYRAGCDAALDSFVKLASGVQIQTFAKGRKGVPVAPQGKPPVMGGAANPAVTSHSNAPNEPVSAKQTDAANSGGGWRGFAKDVGVQAAVPLGMMGLQYLMTPKEPSPPQPSY